MRVSGLCFPFSFVVLLIRTLICISPKVEVVQSDPVPSTFLSDTRIYMWHRVLSFRVTKDISVELRFDQVEEVDLHFFF